MVRPHTTPRSDKRTILLRLSSIEVAINTFTERTNVGDSVKIGKSLVRTPGSGLELQNAAPALPAVASKMAASMKDEEERSQGSQSRIFNV